MGSENLADSKNSNFDCSTRNNVKRANFTCIIENISNYEIIFKPCGRRISNELYSNSYRESNKLCPGCRVKKSKIKDSHTFNFELDSNIKLSLDVYINAHDPGSKDYVSLFLRFNEFSCLKILALCKFSVSRIDGKEEYKSVVGLEKFDANKKSFLKSKLLPGNRLTIFFEIFYLCDNINTYGLSNATPIEETLNMFLVDMSRMLNSSRYCDCMIIVGNQKIKVHKCILDARSEVFHSMLKYKLTGFQEDIIEMSEFRLEVVKEMVNYIYTGKSPRIDEMAIEMVEIAEKYKLEGLKLIATESLLNSLNVVNVCEYLEKSDIYSAEILKEFAIRYIYLNGKEVVKSENWSRIVFCYPLLMARIFDVMVNID
uniref:Speckle-type POZ protein (inferred by orthology to a human protein) n=1 Tax=Strongyloides venezuelensis TaxID=75913 RepID=A0A0K0EYM8_STRVS